MFDVVVLVGHFAARFGMRDADEIVVVEVRSGQVGMRIEATVVMKKSIIMYLSCEVDFGIVGEEHKVELNHGRCDGMLGICQVSPFLRAVRT